MGPWRPFEDFQAEKRDFWRILKSLFLGSGTAKNSFFTTQNHDLTWNLMSKKKFLISAKFYLANVLSPWLSLIWPRSGFAPTRILISFLLSISSCHRDSESIKSQMGIFLFFELFENSWFLHEISVIFQFVLIQSWFKASGQTL